MWLNTALLTWGWRRLRARAHIPLTQVATRSWEICAAETARVPPALCPDGSLDRIEGLSPWRDWATERILVSGGQVDHAASQAHLVENVDLVDAFLYSGAAKAQPGHGPRRLVRRGTGRRQHIPAAHLMSNWAGSHYFGNYMRDTPPLQLLPPDGAYCIEVVTNTYGHEAGYRELLGLPRPPRVASARIDQLTVYTDFAQNSSKAARYRTLRHRLRARLAGGRGVAPAGVYLKRGHTGEPRFVSNEAELERALSARGFETVEPAALSSEQIAQRMLDAPVIIGVEGSHLAHAVYTLADHGTLLVLQPPDRFALPYKEFADRLEMPFAFVVGHRAEQGFRVDVDELERFLDRIE